MSSDVRFHFKGPPTDLKAQTTLVWSRSDGPAPEIESHGRRYLLNSRPHRDRSGTFWSLQIPASTPPGVTEALVHIGGKTYAATVEVSEHRRIALEQDVLSFQGEPGSELVITVPVKNAGNVPQTVSPSSQKIKLRSAGAIARGVRKAFKQTTGDLASRLIVLGEHLSSEPDIDVTFDIKADFTQLIPGEEGRLEIRAHVPKDVHPASEWSSNVPFLGLTVPITLRVAEARPPVKSTGWEN